VIIHDWNIDDNNVNHEPNPNLGVELDYRSLISSQLKAMRNSKNWWIQQIFQSLTTVFALRHPIRPQTHIHPLHPIRFYIQLRQRPSSFDVHHNHPKYREFALKYKNLPFLQFGSLIVHTQRWLSSSSFVSMSIPSEEGISVNEDAMMQQWEKLYNDGNSNIDSSEYVRLLRLKLQ
jgi:hypothetical protein